MQIFDVHRIAGKLGATADSDLRSKVDSPRVTRCHWRGLPDAHRFDVVNRCSPKATESGTRQVNAFCGTYGAPVYACHSARVRPAASSRWVPQIECRRWVDLTRSDCPIAALQVRTRRFSVEIILIDRNRDKRARAYAVTLGGDAARWRYSPRLSRAAVIPARIADTESLPPPARLRFCQCRPHRQWYAPP